MNPAQRLLELIDFFTTTATDKSMQEVWARYINAEATTASEEDVLACVQIALAEVRNMEGQLDAMRVPVQLLNSCADRLREAFSPKRLDTNWRSQHAPAIQNASVRVVLQWASWALQEHNENAIDPETWGALAQALKSQEDLLQSTTDIPLGIRALLERQVIELRRAMALYKLQGVAPIQAAVNHAVGELRTATSELVSELESSPEPVKSLFQKGKELVGQAAELSDKGSKVVKFGKEIYSLGATAWAIGKPLLGLS